MNDQFNSHFRILVVDDNSSIFEDFRALLSPKSKKSIELSKLAENLFGLEKSESSGEASPEYVLDYAANEIEASAMVESSVAEESPYALIFMDSRMTPGLDGVQATRKIWDIDPNIEVVLCTAYTDYTWQEINDIVGASDQFLILKKPFDVSVVKQLASSLTHKWSQKQKFNKYLEYLESHADSLSQKSRLAFSENESTHLDSFLSGESISEHSSLLSAVAELKVMEFDKLQNEFNKNHETIQRITKLLKNIGYIGQYDKRSSSPTTQTTDIRSLVESVTNKYEEKIKKKGIEIFVSDYTTPSPCKVNKEKFEIVIQNLINNSIYAMAKSDIKRLEISFESNQDREKIIIKDSGIGIPDAIKSEIMKPFFTTKKFGSNSGLGLTTAKNIVEHFNGKIYLKNSDVNGSEFHIEIPFHQNN